MIGLDSLVKLSNKTIGKSWAWWYKPIILVTQEVEEDCKFKARLAYTASVRQFG